MPVYDEDPKSNIESLQERRFRHGKDKTPERQEYEHVGIKECVCECNDSKVLERISKGVRALNAALARTHSGEL